MRLTRPKIIGTLKILRMMSGTLAVINDIKNPPNKIIIPCSSIEDGEEIIEKIKNKKAKSSTCKIELFFSKII
ncbi:hypothetical protein HXZ62_10330 [Empedobacter falsenii]|uniref:Uncharacterized protein n=1 Tax=Empedobacter falsenii TaxID=343874 RepID=A0AAW7DQA5_9FLAO|nr:hypothetical protein [Empedobacter falsenii]MDM1062951.1 hypothetical protein [Empedobacter falsenii]MDM1552451.1 hypothetical protein [Empedobacter falsenii]